MKKSIISAIALVAAVSVPVFAQTPVSNNNTSTAQDQAVAVTANVAANGGIANTSTGTVTRSETSTEAETGAIANTSTGAVTSESNNRAVEAERGGVVANGAVTKESNNTFTEADRGGIVTTGAVTKDSGNADDGSILASGAVNANDAEDGGIAATGNVRTTEIEDSFNKQELEVTVGNVLVMVSSSDLDSEVENNTLSAGTRAAITTGNINNRGQAFSNSAGITVVKQNTGFNSQMQTSVNVNADVAK